MNPNTPSLSQPHHSLAFSIYEYPSFQTSHPDMSLTGFGYIVVSPRSSVWTPRGWNALQHPHYISATFLLSFYNLRASHPPDIPSWHVPDRFRVHGGISRALILDPKGTKLTPTPPSISQPYLCLAFTTYEHPTLRTSHPDMSRTGFGYIVASPVLLVCPQKYSWPALTAML